MPVFNYPKKEVNVKVVYYGPGLSGKTTNLQKIHEGIKPEFRGKLISLATQTDRTLFFDFMPMELGSLGGYKIRLHLYTVPGQVHYNATRKLVLKGVDGVVFVADSQMAMSDANVESVLNLEKNLQSYGKSLAELPHVIQANKRDIGEVISMEEIESQLNHYGAVLTEAVASESKGVLETLTEIVRLVMSELRDQFASGSQEIPVSATRPAHEPDQGPADSTGEEPEPEENDADHDREPAENGINDAANAPESELELEPEPEPETEVESEPTLTEVSSVNGGVMVDKEENGSEVKLGLQAAPTPDVKPEVASAALSDSTISDPPIKVLVPIEGVGTLELSISINARMLEKGEVRTITVGMSSATLSDSEPASGRADVVVEESASMISPIPEPANDKTDRKNNSTAERNPVVEPKELQDNLPPLEDITDEPLGSPLDGQESDEQDDQELSQGEKILLQEDLDPPAAEAPEYEPDAGYDPTIQPLELDFPELAMEENKPKKGLFGRFKKR